MKGIVFGVGLNDAGYTVQPLVNGRREWCPFYSRWTNMLKRCYCKKFQDEYPTYIGCSVCKEWLTFSNFKKWMETQDWEGKYLDKDILDRENKVYSQDKCIFVSNHVNTLIVATDSARGSYPLGVYFYKRIGKFHAKVRVNCATQNIGYFDDQYEAHAAWKKSKIAIIISVANEQSDKRLVSALHRIADNLQRDLDAGVETIRY